MPKKSKFTRKQNRDLKARELEVREPGTEYGRVTAVLGSGTFSVDCFDFVTRICKYRAGFRKFKHGKVRVRVAVGSVVLVSLRAESQRLGDIVVLYTDNEIHKLIAISELPRSVLDADDQPDHHRDVAIFDDSLNQEQVDTSKHHIDALLDTLYNSSDDDTLDNAFDDIACLAPRRNKHIVVKRTAAEIDAEQTEQVEWLFEDI